MAISMAQRFAQCNSYQAIKVVQVEWHVQVEMERLEIEFAACDTSSKILAAWPAETRERALTAALPASSSEMKPHSSSSKAALAAMDSRAIQLAAQEASNMGKEAVPRGPHPARHAGTHTGAVLYPPPMQQA